MARVSGAQKTLRCAKNIQEKILIYTSRELPTSRSARPSPVFSLDCNKSRDCAGREIKFRFTISRMDIFRVRGCAIRMGKSVCPPCNKVM